MKYILWIAVLYLSGYFYKIMAYQPLPTIVPARNANPEADAKVLRGALAGMGTNIDTLVAVMSSRSNLQRIQAAHAYKANYRRDLLQHIKSDTNRKFEKMMVALLTPAAEYDAELVRESVKGLGTDLDTLFEVLFTRSPRQIKMMGAAYNRKFKRNLIQDIKGDTSGKVEDLLVEVAKGDRDESNRIDPLAAENVAKKLKSGGISKYFGTHANELITILSKWNFNQLRMFFDQYQRVTKKTIEEDISKYSGGETQKALLNYVKCIKNPAVFLAERIHHAIKGLGTKDKDLIRIFATRTEVDMGTIKNEYYTKYNRHMEKDIRRDVSGKFQKILVALLRGNLQPITNTDLNVVENE
ncbi:unnamed protein product [Gordionus sp. m RMFG-2023]|uniref:annexin A4-like n=1 Tax=Gordionus sp. m RMFG-2023 TaxID=3053472 RepID=UPI0030E4DA83